MKLYIYRYFVVLSLPIIKYISKIYTSLHQTHNIRDKMYYDYIIQPIASHSNSLYTFYARIIIYNTHLKVATLAILFAQGFLICTKTYSYIIVMCPCVSIIHCTSNVFQNPAPLPSSVTRTSILYNNDNHEISISATSATHHTHILYLYVY